MSKFTLSAIMVIIFIYPAASLLQESSITNMVFVQTFALPIPSMKNTMNYTAKSIPQYDVTVEKLHNNIIVKKDKTVLYNGSDAASGIQLGIKYLLPHQLIYIYNGSYLITKPLNLTSGSYMRGQGNNTVLDYSQIGSRNAISMDKNSHLSSIKLLGSIKPSPNDFTQKVNANDNTIIENLVISNMGYGIEASTKYNVTLNNVKCEFIQSKGDSAACIHGTDSTTNLSINNFAVVDSNRGIELGDNATNILVQNGDLLRIKNFNHTGREAFALDVHTHDGGGGADNITYQHIRMRDSYAPTAKVSTVNQRHAVTDLPRDLSYQDITLSNPTSPWQINGDRVNIKNSWITNNSNTNNILIYKNSRNIIIQNVSSDTVSDKHYFIATPPQTTGIKNVAIIGNTIVDGSDKSGSTMLFTGIADLTVRENKILNAPKNSVPISVSSVANLDLNDNNVTYANSTP